MLLTMKMKLHPTKEQHQILLSTMERFSEACNYVSEFAWRNNVFDKVTLQKNLYYDIRHQFSLISNGSLSSSESIRQLSCRSIVLSHIQTLWCNSI
ncbi:MAG: IS605 OrfB family transposase [Methanomicrobiales archaeon 53_19]|nr:MAG: IS605 OrfB family transposase [Methanocalculus sp. 52_23]KUL02852.1 MAG: IS605 OrfB family transposase [Methanomicrobiales archaeon 53_19]